MDLESQVNRFQIVDGFSIEPVRLFSADFSFTPKFLEQFLSSKNHLGRFLRQSNFKFFGKSQNLYDDASILLLSALMTNHNRTYFEYETISDDDKLNGSEPKLIKIIKPVNSGMQILYYKPINAADAKLPHFDLFNNQLIEYCVLKHQLPVFCYFANPLTKESIDVKFVFGYCALSEHVRDGQSINFSKDQPDVLRVYIPSINHVEHAFDVCLSYFKSNLNDMELENHKISQFNAENPNYFFQVAINRQVEEFLKKI